MRHNDNHEGSFRLPKMILIDGKATGNNNYFEKPNEMLLTEFITVRQKRDQVRLLPNVAGCFSGAEKGTQLILSLAE
jgi:hypothetical protein